MGTKRALTPEAAMRIKQLYAEVDALGRGKYSQMEIAKLMGCGETTVYRVIHNAGAYMALPELATEEDAEDSLAVFKQRFPELTPEGTGHVKLVEAAVEHGKGDRMVKELRGGPLDE